MLTALTAQASVYNTYTVLMRLLQHEGYTLEEKKKKCLNSKKANPAPKTLKVLFREEL